MKKNRNTKHVINIIKNHPIRFGVGGATLLIGMGKIVFTLEEADIIQFISVIKNVFANNVAFIVTGLSIMVVSTYFFIYKILELKSNESTDRKIIRQVGDALSKNTNIKSIEVHGHDKEWSISMDTQNKEERSNNNNNMYVLRNSKKETNDKDIKSN